MPTLPIKCPDCGANATLAFGQAAIRCDLRWWESFSCHACDRRFEADGTEEMPPEYRAVLLEQEGTWAAIAEGSPTLALLKAARSCLGLSLNGLQDFRSRLPLLATGTRAEMDVLARRLQRSAGSGTNIRVVRSS